MEANLAASSNVGRPPGPTVAWRAMEPRDIDGAGNIRSRGDRAVRLANRAIQTLSNGCPESRVWARNHQTPSEKPGQPSVCSTNSTHCGCLECQSDKPFFGYASRRELGLEILGRFTLVWITD